MPELLELPHLVEQHGVPEMQVRRRRIETRLYAQRPAGSDACGEILFEENFLNAATELSECIAIS